MNDVLAAAQLDDADLERRFGGLRRLYGDAGYQRLRGLRVAIVGLGGVGSWAAEALARCGVAELVLIDLDQVSESNINRQVQALGATVGQSKVDALAARIADIHPGCRVHRVEEFVEAGRAARLDEAGAALAPAEPGNWPALLPVPVDGVIDACDQVRAKLALAAWALQTGAVLVCCGAAGGKRDAHRLEVDDLCATSHDPLLASLRNRLRREHGAPRSGRLGVRCVFSRETVAAPPSEACELADALPPGPARCHAELPRLRLQRDGDGQLRHGCGGRGGGDAAGELTGLTRKVTRPACGA